jgi:hypothetical protein
VVVTHNNKDLPSSVECRPPAEGDVRGFEEARVRKQGGQLRNRGSSLMWQVRRILLDIGAVALDGRQICIVVHARFLGLGDGEWPTGRRSCRGGR